MIKHITLLAIAVLAALLTVLIFTLPVPDKADVDKADVNGGVALLIDNVRVVQNGELSAPQSILLQDGVIADIGPDIESDAKRIDGSGLTAIAGLIDAHTHSYGSALEDALRFGVTTNIDMFTDISLLGDAKGSRESGAQTDKTDLFSAGMMATAPGGHGTQYGIAIETLTQPAQADAWIAKRKAEGSDFIKMVYMPDQTHIPSIDLPTAKALITAAHKQGLMALAHISTQEAARDLMLAGIDGLVHIFADQPVTSEVIKLAKDGDVFIIPTLSVIASVDGRQDAAALASQQDIASRLSPMQSQTLTLSFSGGAPDFNYDIASENVRKFHQAGVRILAGSDAPNPGTAHGVSLHQELQHLVESGLSPREALFAGSALTATVFSMPRRGDIKIGNKGDILLVRGNPLEDIGAALAIEVVLKNGHRVDRSAAKAKASEALSNSDLGDFETSLSAQMFKWSETSDAMANGNSAASIMRAEGGPRDSAHVLKAVGRISSGFPYPWAGAALSASSQRESYDISSFETVNFDMKGTPGTYRLMVFAAGNMGIPPSQEFRITNSWERVSLKIDEFKGFDAKAFAGLAVVAGTQGPFEFELDNVSFEP